MAELRKLKPLTPRPHIFSLQTSYAGHREINLPVQMLNQFVGQTNRLITNVESIKEFNPAVVNKEDFKFKFEPPLELSIPMFNNSKLEIENGSYMRGSIRVSSLKIYGVADDRVYAGWPIASAFPNGVHDGYKVAGNEYYIGFKNGGHVKIKDGDFQIVEVGSTIYRGDQKHWIQISFGYYYEIIKIRFNVFKNTRGGPRSVRQSIHIKKSKIDGSYWVVKGKVGLGFLKEFCKNLDRMALNYGCIENAFLLDRCSPWGLLTLLRHARAVAT